MALNTPADIPVQVTVPNSSDPTGAPLVSAERRITPSWTVGQLKLKLEPVTGIPSSAQSLRTRGIDGIWVTLSDESSLLGDSRYGLRRGTEIEVHDSRPPIMRQEINFSDLSSVEKYQMPESQYENLEDSVLAWKRRQKLGRFDPNVKSPEAAAKERLNKDQAEIAKRGVELEKRVRVGRDDGRRGTVKYVGEIIGLGGDKEAGCVWIGVELDEPVGKNDGSVIVEGDNGRETIRLFDCKDNFGVFVRPEKVEVGDFPPLDDLLDEMEEI